MLIIRVSMHKKGTMLLKKWVIALVIILILAIGGFAMFPTKLPETKAFQDKYTRQFMGSSKEVESGYYLYKSKTGGYTMLFPKDAKLSKMFYTREKDYFEHVWFGDSEKDTNVGYYTKVLYEDKATTSYIKERLSTLSQGLKYSGEYKEITNKGNTIYSAKQVARLEPNMTEYRFFSYIKSNKSDQAIEFIYSVSCNDERKKCTINVKEEEVKALKLMKSIQFNN